MSFRPPVSFSLASKWYPFRRHAAVCGSLAASLVVVGDRDGMRIQGCRVWTGNKIDLLLILVYKYLHKYFLSIYEVLVVSLICITFVIHFPVPSCALNTYALLYMLSYGTPSDI